MFTTFWAFENDIPRSIHSVRIEKDDDEEAQKKPKKKRFVQDDVTSDAGSEPERISIFPFHFCFSIHFFSN